MLDRFLVSLFQPFNLLFVFVVLVLAVWWVKRAAPRRLLAWLVVPTGMLYLFCTPAVAYLAVGLLEWSYPPIEKRPDGADAIVVLSGDLHPPNDVRRRAVLGESSLYRCMKGAQLYHSASRCKVVLSGGRVDLERPGPTMAEAMSEFVLQLGIDAEDLILEKESRSTYENAVHTAALLSQQNIDSIALVTDATHLERSIRCFEKQGLSVVGCGCHYRATKFDWTIFSFLPSADAARHNQAVFYEWLGLTWYWLNDRI